MRNCEIIPPLPPPLVSTCYQVVSWTSLSGLVQLVVFGNKSCSVSVGQFGRSATCRQFWWEVASSLFCASKQLFWLVGWWRDKIWCGGKPICGGAPSIADYRWRWPPAHRVLPTRQVWWGSFSGCVAKFVAGCVARFVLWQCCQVFRQLVLVLAILVVWSRDRAVTVHYRAAQQLREPVKISTTLVLGVRYQVYECTGQESLRLRGRSLKSSPTNASSKMLTNNHLSLNTLSKVVYVL